MSNLIFLTITLALLALILLIIGLTFLISSRRVEIGSRALFIIGLILLIISPFLLISAAITKDYADEQVIIEKANSGYTVYYEGEEVDIDNFDLSAYNIKCEDDTKRIFLSKMERRTSVTYVPYIVP